MQRLPALLILIIATVWLATHVASGMMGATGIFRLVKLGLFTQAEAGLAAGQLFRAQMLLSSACLALLALVALATPRLRAPLMIPAVFGTVLVVFEAQWTTPTMEALREECVRRYGSLAAAPADDASRRAFGQVHGMSMIRALQEMVLAAATMVGASIALLRPGTNEKRATP